MRAKRVTNIPRLNEDLDQASLLRKYERELRRLRAELEERNRNVVDQRCLLELEERRRRAEENKHGGRRRPHLVAWRFRLPAVPGLTRATGRSGIKREK